MRWLAVGFIELFRGVPLVALLFIGQYLIIFAFPTSVDPPSFLVRALIVIALFETAYIAEIVRGGLQSVPARPGRGRPTPSGIGPGADDAQGRAPPGPAHVIPGDRRASSSASSRTPRSSRSSGSSRCSRSRRSVPSQSDFAGRGLSSITLAFAGFIYWVGCLHAVAGEPPARAPVRSGNPMSDRTARNLDRTPPPSAGGTGETMIAVEGVEKWFGNFAALKGIDLVDRPAGGRGGDRPLRIRQVDAHPLHQPARGARPRPHRRRRHRAHATTCGASRRCAARSAWCSRASTSSRT